MNASIEFSSGQEKKIVGVLKKLGFRKEDWRDNPTVGIDEWLQQLTNSTFAQRQGLYFPKPSKP